MRSHNKSCDGEGSHVIGHVMERGSHVIGHVMERGSHVIGHGGVM